MIKINLMQTKRRLGREALAKQTYPGDASPEPQVAEAGNRPQAPRGGLRGRLAGKLLSGPFPAVFFFVALTVQTLALVTAVCSFVLAASQCLE